MAFVAPTRNLSCNYWYRATWVPAWNAGAGAVPAPDLTVDVQLRPPKPSYSWASFVQFPLFEVIFEKGEDVRPAIYGTGIYYYWMDVCEVPAGSGCYYMVGHVIDVAKGFLNEYRVAFVFPSWGLESPIYNSFTGWPYAPTWPRPLP